MSTTNTSTNPTTNPTTPPNINNSNLFNDLSNSDILFINILNTVYNDNLRMIHHLMDHNNEITYQLIDIMNNRRTSHNPSNNRSYTRDRERNYNNIRYRNNQTSDNNTHNSQRRVFIDSMPYYVDNLQLFSMPNVTTNSNLGNQFSRIINSFLEPVNITPTQTQIVNATRNIIYGDILDPINTSCPISLEPFTETSNVTMIRHCKHIFNTSNLMSWFNSNCKCPVCRYDIRNYNTNNTRNSNNINNTRADQEEQEQQEEEQEEQSSNNGYRIDPTREESNRVETLFFELFSDLSYNNIELSSFFPTNTRREVRR